jgi:hypothetical protein
MRRRLSHSRSPSPSRGGFSGSSFPKRFTNKEIMARLALAGACVLLVVFLIQFSASQNAPSKLKAVVILAGNSTVLGTIRFEQDSEPPRSNYLQQASNPLHITGKITGQFSPIFNVLGSERSPFHLFFKIAGLKPGV